jgi:probable LLM family oxidoreductase
MPPATRRPFIRIGINAVLPSEIRHRFDFLNCRLAWHFIEMTNSKTTNDQKMQVGIDSFATAFSNDAAGLAGNSSDALRHLVDRIEYAEQVGLDVFGIGEHHRREFLDSAPPVILAAAAAKTKRIRLTSAVTVLSAADPVRVFQQFATLDLLSQGRAEMVVGRGSFIESFPLFGLQLEDYDSLFSEKLDLLLNIRENELVHWSGKHRAALTGQGVYPRPFQNPFPIWLGVGGTPESFARAGALGLPLMVAIIGGETRRFRPLVDLYREAARRAGYKPEQLKVGVHALGYVADTTQQAVDDFFPGYAKAFTEIGKERGWPPVTRAHFNALLGTHGALMVGNPEEVAEKILEHSDALGGINRISFQMDVASLPHPKLVHSIELIGTRVAPILRAAAKNP